MITKLREKVVLYSQPYKVSWVNSVSIDVKDRCLLPILFATYSDKIWCVVTMVWAISFWDDLGYMTETSLSMDVQAHAHLFMRKRRSN